MADELKEDNFHGQNVTGSLNLAIVLYVTIPLSNSSTTSQELHILKMYFKTRNMTDWKKWFWQFQCEIQGGDAWSDGWSLSENGHNFPVTNDFENSI